MNENNCSKKRFYTQYGVGHVKYLVSYHNGIDKHSDGSDFFNVALFKNKKKLKVFTDNLKNNGYIYWSGL